jgi:hypothetical protein
MTATDNSNRMILDVPWTFRVFATSQVSKTGKQIAADLIALIMTVFDGDVTTSRKPAELTLDNGSFLETQYQNDYGAQASDGFYAWTVSYTFRLDFPFAT